MMAPIRVLATLARIRTSSVPMRGSCPNREGIVLHDVRYKYGGVTRPVMHRVSLVEMAVPYADPRYVLYVRELLKV